MASQDLTPQLRTRLGRVERLVGLFVSTAALLLLAGFIYFLHHTADKKGWFVQKIPYYTMIGDGTGIQIGADVKIIGFKIGQVTLLEPMPFEAVWERSQGWNVYVGFEIREPYDGYILTDSSVRLGAGDFLGGRSLDMVPGKIGEKTAQRLANGHMGHLHEKYCQTFTRDRTKATNEFRRYLEIKKGAKGYFLLATEQQPLPEKLTAIANDLHASLPGVFAMTNSVNTALINLSSMTAQLDRAMPMLSNTLKQAELLINDLRPLTQRPGGIGELLVPTNLNAQLGTVLSNVNSRSELVGPTLSNLNGLVSQIGITVSNLNHQLDRDTNLVGNVSRLADKATSLAESTDTLLRRHWLFRSAFKTNKTELKQRGR
ncbi:MAG: hypothetical protein EXS36_18050 [Pedosphaera sp.]|nr:hypothetical protein [Pedosphaera sp.]